MNEEYVFIFISLYISDYVEQKYNRCKLKGRLDFGTDSYS